MSSNPNKRAVAKKSNPVAKKIKSPPEISSFGPHKNIPIGELRTSIGNLLEFLEAADKKDFDSRHFFNECAKHAEVVHDIMTTEITERCHQVIGNPVIFSSFFYIPKFTN